MKTIKKEKIKKRVNRKQSLKKFIESGHTDKQAFFKACKNDENLLIYTCLDDCELDTYIEKMKEFEDVQDQIAYLVENQPPMNANLKRYNKCVDSIAKYLKGYIEFNGFSMNNRAGSNSDWSSTFWLKFYKICEFYRIRWFFPEKLEKKSSVVYNHILYKEFLYICRMSISSERKYLAFLATQDWWSSLFSLSLDSKVEGDGEGDKTLGEIIPSNEDEETLTEEANVTCIIDKALNICKRYSDAAKHYDKIEDFYRKQDPSGFDKKTVILGKIFLYKAGLVSPKIISFIKSLSNTYKIKYNLSMDRADNDLERLKSNNMFKSVTKKKTDENKTWRDLVFKKRGFF